MNEEVATLSAALASLKRDGAGLHQGEIAIDRKGAEPRVSLKELTSRSMKAAILASALADMAMVQAQCAASAAKDLTPGSALIASEAAARTAITAAAAAAAMATTAAEAAYAAAREPKAGA
ncbi:MAG: hypothetical protein IH606_19275 [Burkholderiales bacterium]|nr:hypothetical protein [Burkholderiales bacterium]